MTADEYLAGVVQQVSAPTGILGPGERVRTKLYPVISQWAGGQLAGVAVSGSYAKGTAIIGGTDVDLFISLKADTTNTLKEIYDSLAARMTSSGYTCRKQNVSIGVTADGLKIDLVPGKLQNAWSRDHRIYVSRQQTWQKTNVERHIELVSGSGCVREIKLAKRWRSIHNLEFPSFALELSVLKALSGTWSSGLATRFTTVLEFLRDRLATASLQDPANTNNNVADEMTITEKRAISSKAASSLGETFWERIVW